MSEILLATAVLALLLTALAAALLSVRRRLIPVEGLDVTVNDAVHLSARRGDTLLEVLRRANIGVPAACGGKGSCGLCRVVATGQGAGEPGATERGLLAPKERRAHVRLACQTSLRGDCEVRVPGEMLSAGGGQIHRVVSTRTLAPLIRELVLTLPDGSSDELLETFRAGDFMQITAPPYRLDFAHLALPDEVREAWRIAGWDRLVVASEHEVTRAYSLANRPEDAGTAVFDIRLAVPPAGREHEVPPGIVSSWLFSLEPGDEVTVGGPFGDFHAQRNGREMVFVGGGVGMAPLRAMIHEELAEGGERRVRYLFGARSRADLFYAEEFEGLAARHARFSWTPALSDPAPGDRWSGRIGFVHEALHAEMAAHAAPDDCEYYLCGPPVMVSAVLDTLATLGVERDAIFFDDFGA